MKWTQLKIALAQHYSAPLMASFKQFRLGLSLFFLGLVVIWSGQQLLAPSIAQEVVTLIGLLVLGVGFLISMMAQVRILISRIWQFFKEPAPQPCAEVQPADNAEQALSRVSSEKSRDQG